MELINYTDRELTKEIVLVEEFLQTVKDKDVDGLILNNKQSKIDWCEIEQLEDNSIYFNIHISCKLDRSNNSLKLYIDVDLKTGALYIYEYIQSISYPKNRKSSILILDNIELGWKNSQSNLIIREESDISKVSKDILIEGYSVWGNKWGYITKRGRHSRGALSTRLGWKINKNKIRKNKKSGIHYFKRIKLKYHVNIKKTLL